MPPSPRVSTPSIFSAAAPVDRGDSASAAQPTINDDAAMWHRLKVAGKRTPPERYSVQEVPVNKSKIECVQNACSIQVVPNMDMEQSQPIHANRVEQLRDAETPFDRPNLTYAAGQSPTQHNYKNMLIQGIESGLGTFQLVSTKAHRDGSDSKETTLITMLREEFKRSPNAPVKLSDRYEVTEFKAITDGDDGADYFRYAMTVSDEKGNKTTVPLTQAALRFTGKVLQPEAIKRADELMVAHCEFVSKQTHVKNDDFEWKNLMVLSHAGYGRNATVITYCRMAALADQNEKAVNEDNLQDKLEAAIKTGMESRDPHFVHSQPQMSALRTALAERLSEKKKEHPNRASEGSARRRIEVASDGGVEEQKSIDPPALSPRAVPLTPVASVTPTVRIDANPPPQKLTERQQQVVDFFSSEKEFNDGKTPAINLKIFSSFNDTQIEEIHHFIQRLFPLDSASRNNSHAPVLNGADFLTLRNNEKVSQGLSEAFERMLKFYRLERDGNKIVADGSRPMSNFLGQLSHHNLRFSRIIRSMALFGKAHEARALLAFLEAYCKANDPGHPSLPCWKDALDTPTAVSAADENDYPSLLFPNKVLLNDPVPWELRPNPNKRRLFAKQREFYEGAYASSENSDVPLKAIFTSLNHIGVYKNKTYLDEKVNAPKPCNITTHDGFYFIQQASDLTDSSQRTQTESYVVHVDFANQRLGGRWKDD